MSYPYFHVHSYSVSTKRTRDGESLADASIDMTVGGVRRHHTVAGVGPVHALEQALRMCLEDDFPATHDLRLCDYQVSVVDAALGTRASVRVIIQATDGLTTWDAGAVSNNVIEASFEALCSATVMGILRSQSSGRRSA